MKSFKDYREKTKNKPENMETVFGCHSVPKDARKNMETVFGKHSQEKESDPQKISEATHLKDEELAGHLYSEREHDHIHNVVAPLHEDKASGTELEAVSDYTDESRPINGLLHRHSNGYGISQKSHQSYKDTVRSLDRIMGRRSTTEDTHLFTGLKHSPTKHFKKVDGEIPEKVEVNLPAFTSTSTSVKAARGFSEYTSHPYDDRMGIAHLSSEQGARHILKIHVPKGTAAMSLREKSFAPEENEILIHRGHKLSLEGKPQKVSDDTYIWNAKIISHKLSDLDKEVE